MRRRAARGGSQPRSAVGPFPGDCARSPCGHHRAVRRSAVMTRSGASFTLALARGGSSMNERQVESGQRVTPLELFFDLVFVFAITQVTGFLAADATWIGLLRGLLLLGALWWAWAAYAWLTNTLNPEEGAVRLFVFGSIGAMLIVSLATRNAFGTDGVVFGVASSIVRALHLALYAIAGRGDRELLRAVARLASLALVAL